MTEKYKNKRQEINRKIDELYKYLTIEEIREERFTGLEYILKRLVETGKISESYAVDYLAKYRLSNIRSVKKVKFTVRPNQWTKKYFMYYESNKPNKEIEKKLMQVARKRGYAESHKVIFKNKIKVRGSDYIILD